VTGPYRLRFNQTVTPDVVPPFTPADSTINGSYTMVLNNSTELAATSHFGSLSGYGDWPDIEPAIYSMTVNMTYHSPRLLYRTEVRAAQGELND
jgi:hypothetical protein